MGSDHPRPWRAPQEPQKGNSSAINEGGGPPIAPEMEIYYARREFFLDSFSLEGFS